MKNFNAEMIEKAKTVKSAEELLELAKASNVEMTADEAAAYFAQLNPKSGELDDDDLDAVAGGACADSNDNDTPAVGAGDTVQITSEAACPDCGGKIGTVSKKHSRGYCIKCKNARSKFAISVIVRLQLSVNIERSLNYEKYEA